MRVIAADSTTIVKKLDNLHMGSIITAVATSCKYSDIDQGIGRVFAKAFTGIGGGMAVVLVVLLRLKASVLRFPSRFSYSFGRIGLRL
jgi:hypothetical protein